MDFKGLKVFVKNLGFPSADFKLTNYPAFSTPLPDLGKLLVWSINRGAEIATVKKFWLWGSY